MNFKKTMFALAVGSVGIMGAMSAHASDVTGALHNGDSLSITTSTLDASGNVVPGTGSWFGMDSNGNGAITNVELIILSQGTTGIVIGQATTAGASHGGLPVAGDTNAITRPWDFLGNTGSDFTTTGITGSTTAGLNFSGWRVTWNGIPPINMGGGAWGTGFTNGVANFTWNGVYGSAYTLDYAATTPLGDPSGIGGVRYALRLTGTVTPVPEASTYGMMLAGLGLVGFAVRRRKLVA